MGETKSATDGFRRITRLAPQAQIRVFGFMLIVICGGALLAWITRSIWDQLDQLQKEHAAIRSESFYLGVTLRGGIRSLNGKLFQFGRSRDPSLIDEFQKEADDLEQWMQLNRLHVAEAENPKLVKTLGLSEDIQLLDKVEASYQTYLARVGRIMSLEGPPPELDSFEEIYLEVQDASWELLGLCDQLVAIQSKGFGEFLSGTQKTLFRHQRLLQLTSAVILLMAGMLTLQVYRGMIAPLRRELTQSKKIIERQEKLASLGVLASGVAHEIRNPLTAIKFRLFSLQKTLPALASNEDAAIIANEINRLERIVKDFLRFARPSDPELTRVSARQLLADAQQLLGPQFERNGVRVKAEADPDIWINADPQQLTQVLINLMQNAAEAIDGQGEVRLKARADTAKLSGKVAPAAVLSVVDTGRGISPSIEERLFDPFFTTKDRGTGLGLAIAARIVEKHGGILRYETEVRRGTTFEIVLPLQNHESTNTAAY